ncbi:MAG: hypothetical protein M1337_08830 [Actinobacteria bacterium]|nr:hypothetical protein [Actinomycetota bacterium]
MKAFIRYRRRNQARPARVNRALARLNEWEAAQLMPLEIRPDAPNLVLGRKALESLRETLEELLKETEEMWERRN